MLYVKNLPKYVRTRLRDSVALNFCFQSKKGPRFACGTLNPKSIPDTKKSFFKEGYEPTEEEMNQELVMYYDLSVSDWRSFHASSIVSIEDDEVCTELPDGETWEDEQ